MSGFGIRGADLVRDHERAGRHVVAGGRRIFVREEGEGPPVLLVHGVPASSFLYRRMMAPLAKAGLRAVAFDLPGLGLSEKGTAAGAYDWHALSAAIEPLVDALGLRDLHLVIHDIGGPIGAEWAMTHPARVRSLTIMNTILDPGRFSPPFPMWLFRLPALRHLAIGTLTPFVFTRLMRVEGVYDRAAISAAVGEAYFELLVRDGGRRSFLDVMAGFDLTAAFGDRLRAGIAALGAPTQIVWGAHEIAIPVAQLDYVRATFPIEEEHLVPGRHFPQEDCAAQCARVIAAFAKRYA